MKYSKNVALVALLWLMMLPAYAGMVTTPEFAGEPVRAPLTSITAQRLQVQQQLIDLGVEPAEATMRVNQMTDQQISKMEEEIRELPAGAGVSTTNLLLIIIILILLL